MLSHADDKAMDLEEPSIATLKDVLSDSSSEDD